MKINGQIFEVTDMAKFAMAYLANSSNPGTAHTKTAANIRVHLASVIPAMPFGFFPSLSLKTYSGSDGKFSFNVSAAQLKQLKSNKMAYILAYRKTGSMQVMGQTIEIFEPVYRSEAFDITKYKPPTLTKLYFAPYNVPDSAGISQTMVDEQIKAAKKKFKDIDKLSAGIQNGYINVTGSGRGATIKFKIDLSVSTSSNLSSYIKGKVDDLDIDLPGPDFIVGICVSKDDIAKDVDKGIAEIMKEANKTVETELINQVAAQTGQSKAIISSLMKTMATVTFRSLSYPVVGSKTVKVPGIPAMKIDIRAVVPRLSIGLPRKL